MARIIKAQTAQDDFCNVKNGMESLYWSMQISRNATQALIHTQTMIADLKALEKKLINEIENTENEEI